MTSNCDIMYKKLCKEHQQLQRSFATVCHSLNEALSKSQRTKDLILNCNQKKISKKDCEALKKQIELLSFELREARDQNELLEFGHHESQNVKMTSSSDIMYKKLCKEHQQLQRSFATVCHSLNEALSKSQRTKDLILNCNQKKISKKEFEGLKRQIELLSFELQESRDQNELLEFRLHESEHFKGLSKNIEKNAIIEENKSKDLNIACLNCSELELQLSDASNENQKLNERFNASQKAFQQLIEKYNIKEEYETLLHNNLRLNNEIKCKSKNILNNNFEEKLIRVAAVELDVGYIGSAMTSEDEGLGDDTRRDHSSGPSSLADLQEPEYDVISVQSPLQLTCKDALFCKNDKCLEERGERKQVSAQTENDELIRLQVVHNQGYVEQLEQSCAKLKEEKASLEEQVLELEEAENDARLISQRLQRKLDTLLFQYETMHSDLIDTKKTIDFNNNKIKTLEKIEIELRAQIAEMRSVITKTYSDGSLKNENCMADESKRVVQHEDFMNRLTVLENEGKHLCEQLHQVDRLYSILWQKLYKLEIQINTYKQSTQSTQLPESGESVASLSQHDSDDDLQMFISEEKLTDGVSGIGSSFDVTKFDLSCDSLQTSSIGVYKQGEDLVLSLPLCETVKPERIDVMMSSPKIRSTSPVCLPPEIMSRINKLESNEQQLKDRLIQLEWINKEFVRELELREQIFVEREKKHNEWLSSENELKENISQLHTERNKLDIKLNALEAERKQLIEEIVLQRNTFQQTKREHEKQLNEAQIEQNNVFINMQMHINELESKEQEYISKIESFECSAAVDDQISADNNKLKYLSDNYSILKDELRKEKENIVKLKEDFATELSNLRNYHISHENELKNRIKELEDQKTNFTTKLQTLTDQQTFLKQLSIDKENELKKLRQTHEERLNILEEEHKLVERELRMKMTEMENQTSTTVKELEVERSVIHAQLEEAYTKLKCSECDYTKKIEDLSIKVDKLESKLAELLKDSKNLDNVDIERAQLKSEITAIQSSERELRTKLSEMMQKEAAYEETLSKADHIIATLELNYKQRIEELESSESTLKAKIAQLEDIEMRLRSALRPERRSSESYRKASDLVEELIDAEARECALKEQIRTLEASITQMQQNIDESDHFKRRIETELKDHDELVSTVVNLQQQIELLKRDLNKSLQSQDSLQDMLKDTEKYCLHRDEEMHIKYKSMEDEKCHMEIVIQQLKHKLRHLDKSNDSFESLESLTKSNNYTFDEKAQNTPEIVTQDCNPCIKSVDFEPSPTKDKVDDEVDDARLNMEKCLKRAMVVVQMEMRQKDKFDHSLPLEHSEEDYSSLSLSSCSYSSDETDKSNYESDSISSQQIIDNFANIIL